MRYFNLALLFTYFLFLSCKQKTVEVQPEKKDFSKDIDAICSCVKSYREFEEKSELLKFTNTDADLINDVVALEIQMNECLAEQLENYKSKKEDLDPLLSQKCPQSLKLIK